MSVDDKKNSEMLQKHVAQLMEHFDTVQIFATLHDQGDTIQYIEGEGNYFARLGQAKLWVERQINNNGFAIKEEE